MNIGCALFCAFVAVSTGGLAMAGENRVDVPFVSLAGDVVASGNPVGDDGRIHKVTVPAVRLMRTDAKNAKGTILLFPGGGYSILAIQHEGDMTARFLNAQGFDVAILEYHVSAGPTTRDLALEDALAAFRLLKSRAKSFGLHGNRLGIMGYSAGGHLAARTVQHLKADEQPDYLVLIYPAYLQENLPNTNTPAVKPPAKPAGRLFALIAANDKKEWVESCRDYSGKWKANGGSAVFHLLSAGGHGFGMKSGLTPPALTWPDLLKEFLQQ